MGETKVKGLGDTLENLIKKLKLTEIVGKRECKGCKARKDKLNKIFPYNNLTI